MPAKNSLKQYLENGYYHLYNRGVEKRQIFLDKQDYSVFLSYLKEYLTPKDEKSLLNRLANSETSWTEKDKIIKALRLNNFANEFFLLAFCLMPNHFHLLVKQIKPDSIDRFLSSIGTRYTMYFNRKYKRVGPLYQGVYKAVPVYSDEQLLQLSRYIHRQALNLQGETLQAQEVQPSSYGEYLGKRNTEWVKTTEILDFFPKNHPSLSYESFIREANDLSQIGNLLLEE
jgi:putative transposase